MKQNIVTRPVGVDVPINNPPVAPVWPLTTTLAEPDAFIQIFPPATVPCMWVFPSSNITVLPLFIEIPPPVFFSPFKFPPVVAGILIEPESLSENMTEVYALFIISNPPNSFNRNVFVGVCALPVVLVTRKKSIYWVPPVVFDPDINNATFDGIEYG